MGGMLEVRDSMSLCDLRFMREPSVAGTLEALSAMALKHLEDGVASPFLVSTRLGLLYLGADVGLFP